MKSVILTILLLLSFCIGFSQQTQKKKTFEGYIDYNIEFKSFSPAVSDNELKERVGYKIRIFYNNRGFKWVFTDEMGYIRSYLIDDLKANTNYYWYDDFPDTIYTYNLSNNKRLEIDTVFEVGEEIILGRKCKKVKLLGRSNYENPHFSVPTIYTYSFCESLAIDPKLYENFNEMRWNEIVMKYKSIALKIVTEYTNEFMATFSATSITQEKVDDSIFVLDKTKFFKPTFVDRM